MADRFVPLSFSANGVAAGCEAGMSAAKPALDIPDFPTECLLPNGTLPKIGTIEWCNCIDAVMNWVAAIGNSALDYILPAKKEEEKPSFWGIVLSTIKPGGLAGLAASTLYPEVERAINDKIHDIADKIKEIISKAKLCNPSVIIGIEVLKALVGALSKIRAGTDAVIWLTIDISFVLSLLNDILNYIGHYACPVKIPEMSAVIHAYMGGTVDERLIRCWSAMHGYDWDTLFPAIYAERRKPEPGELAEIRNREYITEDKYDEQLRMLGFLSDSERAGIRALKYNVPGPSDLVRFAVRHVFEPDLLEKFGFNDERDRGAFRLDAYHHTAGLDYPIFSGPLKAVVESVTGIASDALAADYTARGLPEPTWAHAHWWAHWIIPPQSWAADARFRLDPTRDVSLEPDWMKGIKFTEQDYNDLLRMNDYPPYFRDKMFALSYRPPQMRFIRVMLAQDQFTEDQVIDSLKRLGMMPEVARLFARAIVLDVADKNNPVRGLEHNRENRVFRSIIKAYKIGTLTYEQAFALCREIGLKSDTTEIYLKATDSDLRADAVSRAIRVIKRDYFEGAIDQLTAGQLLARITLAPARIEQLTTEWQLERGLTVKMASTEKLISWYSQGIIDQASLQLRLTNLGWYSPDLLAYLAESELRLQKRESTQRAAGLKSAKANAALIEKLLRDVRKQEKELATELRRLTPVGTLIKWARQGSVSEIYFENRLEAMGYPPEQIAQYWQEVLKDGPIPDKSAKYTVPSQGTIIAPEGPSTQT